MAPPEPDSRRPSRQGTAGTTRSTLDHVLGYIGAGLKVIPITPGQKRPSMSAWQNAATTNETIVRSWWTGLYADHGIGLAPGQLPDGRYWFAVDIDQHGVDGAAVWADLCDGHGGAPETVEATTGGGGTHLIFASPLPIRNGQLSDGIDIRGIGGQIVVEPTIHPSGQPYTWIDGQAPDQHAIADAPGWLLTLLARPEPTERPTAPVDRSDRPGDQWSAVTTWAQILEPDGWTLARTDRDGECYWTRPGKDVREGVSATSGHGGSDVLKVFTSSAAPLRAEETYTKLGYLAAVHHHGNHSAAASALRDAGHGDPTPDIDVLGLNQITSVTPPAPGRDWPEPIPLGTVTALPPFPVHVLPDWIADYATEVGDDIQVPVDLPAILAIGALATLAAGHLKIRVAGRWVEHVNLFLVVAMPPSTGKSPTYKAMCSPVLELEREYQLQTRATVSANADKVDAIEGELKRAKQLADIDISSLAEIRTRLHEAQDQQTTQPRLTIGDATPEALEVLIAQNGGRMAVHSTEGGVFAMMTGRYSETANLDIYLQGWSGDRLDSSRISREANQVDEAILSMVLTVQPKVISDLAERPELAGRGLTARFMYSMPPDVLGLRDLSLRPTVGTGHHDAYGDHLRTLGRRFLSWHTPAEIRLDDDAAQHYTDWRQSLERRRTTTGDLRPMAEWTGKLESSVLRLAALLHFAHGHDYTADVTLATMTQALAVGEYWLAHAGHVHDLWGTSPEITAARKIVDWADTLKGSTFSVRDLHAANRTTFKKADETLPALHLLTERGWTRTVDGGPVATVRNKRSVVFEVHPELSTVCVTAVEPVLRGRITAPPPFFDIDPEEGAREHASQVPQNRKPVDNRTTTESHDPSPPTPDQTTDWMDL